MARKKKVLIIEDEVELVKVIEELLQLNNYKVATAYDGEEGLKKAYSENPDLIILDIMLPAMNGYDVCRKLKINERCRKVPIIICSAKFQPNDIEFGAEMGAAVYLTKPIELSVLLKKVRELVKKPLIPRGEREKEGAL